ncbi:hypothetical protein PoB_005833600 [Plakobranchus ocellatus]|uniref:Uncharacterized protein n=1 Tax=Plakobranchus ocellatus TaxID=259542 RepID=A0AAV4CJX7_9GAST|nr:hypothetical protein PoB_005833600 [Plakobranchus ocellatus]
MLGKLICWSDLKPKVNAYIHSVWQKNWDAEGANKLHDVLPNLGEDLHRKGEGADLDEAVRPPPPYAMFLPEMKDLFEPQCTIELIDRGSLEFRPGKDLKPTYYLIVKQWNQNGLPSEEK